MSAGDGWGKPTPPRNEKGQFNKGFTANRRGRPKKRERAFTHSQVRQDVLGLMEREVDIKIFGKNERMPVILALYWRMLLKGVEGNERMILAAIELRRDLLREHKAANYDLIRSFEEFEKMLAENGGVLDHNTLGLLNELRKQTRGNSH